MLEYKTSGLSHHVNNFANQDRTTLHSNIDIMKVVSIPNCFIEGKWKCNICDPDRGNGKGRHFLEMAAKLAKKHKPSKSSHKEKSEATKWVLKKVILVVTLLRRGGGVGGGVVSYTGLIRNMQEIFPRLYINHCVEIQPEVNSYSPSLQLYFLCNPLKLPSTTLHVSEIYTSTCWLFR